VCGQSKAGLTGQGSAAQQTPQPLHGLPNTGFAGACAWILMIYWVMAMLAIVASATGLRLVNRIGK
jgi:hypothetical protein